MIRPKIYLAGPITGLTFGEAKGSWRQELSSMIITSQHYEGGRGLDLVSPMRHRFGNLEKQSVLSSMGDESSWLDNPKNITARDRYDVMTCDMMVACFLGAQKISAGSMIEFGWADAWRKPIVLVMEPDNVHKHAMVQELAGWQVTRLEQAAKIIITTLTPGV